MATRAELENTIRELLGSSNTALSSVMIQSSIDSALDDLARLRPKIVYQEFSMVPNQTEYSVPNGVYNVLDVIFPETSGYSSVFDYEFIPSIYDSDINPYYSQSLSMIDAMQRSNFSNMYGFNWEYDIDSHKVLLFPTPVSTGKMVMQLAYRRELSEVPPNLIKAIQDLATAESMRTLAVTYGGQGILTIPIGIGSVAFNPGMLTTQADLLREKALTKISSVGGGAVMFG